MLAKIMPYEDYLNLGRYPNPYLFFIRKSGKLLYYLGSSHCFDPANSTMSVLKHYWNDFLNQIAGKEAIVFVEGGKRIVRESEDEAVLNDGEAGLLTYLAKKESIECVSPEPSFEYETKSLLSKYSKDEILTYYFIRHVSQWNRLVKKPDFTKYLQSSLNKYKEILAWEDIDFSVSARIEIFEKIVGEKLDISNSEMTTRYDNPVDLLTVINKVSRESGLLRDEYIVKQIKDSWDNGKNIFVVYGKTHAIMQEPSIKSF